MLNQRLYVPSEVVTFSFRKKTKSCNLRNEKIYIQVSDDIGNDFENSKFKREVDSLLKIKDAYPKILIARTKHDNCQYEGVQIIDISNWLSE